LDSLSVHHQELKTAYIATVYVKQLLLPAAIGDEMERQKMHISTETSKENCTKQVQQYGITKSVEKNS
jgi:hypothetical protein